MKFEPTRNQFAFDVREKIVFFQKNMVIEVGNVHVAEDTDTLNHEFFVTVVLYHIRHI